MPVVARPARRPESREPSGLEKFLRVAGLATNVAGGVQDFITSRRQLDIQERLADLQEQRIGLDIENLATESAERRLAVGMANAIANRNATLRQMASQGENIDPGLTNAAPTLGDIANPALRATTEEALKEIGISEEALNDRFILSETNLTQLGQSDRVGEALQDAYNLTLLQGLGQAPGTDIAAQTGVVGSLSGIQGATGAALQRRRGLENMANELLRLEEDPETGELTVSGAAINNPTQTLDTVLQMIGEDPLPKEFDPRLFGIDAPSRIISGPVFEELWTQGLASLYSKSEDYTATLNDTAQVLSDGFQIPLADARAALEGRYEDVTAGNQNLVQAILNFNRAQTKFVGSINPGMRAILALGGYIRNELGLPAEDVVTTLEELTNTLADQIPGLPVVRSKGAIRRLLNNLVGGSNFEFDDPPVPATGDPGTEGGTTGSTGLVPGSQAQQMSQDAAAALQQQMQQQQRAMSAMGPAFNQAAQWLSSFDTEAERQAAAQSITGPFSYTDPESGQERSSIVPAEDVQAILDRANQINPLD